MKAEEAASSFLGCGVALVLIAIVFILFGIAARLWGIV